MLDLSSLSCLKLDVRFLGSDCDVLMDLDPPEAMVTQFYTFNRKHIDLDIHPQILFTCLEFNCKRS